MPQKCFLFINQISVQLISNQNFKNLKMLCVSYCSTMRNINRNLERLYCIDFFPSAERFKKTAIHSLQIQGPALMINFKGAKSLLCLCVIISSCYYTVLFSIILQMCFPGNLLIEETIKLEKGYNEQSFPFLCQG